MYLIIGLGNPGKKHSDTRHNIGFRAIYSLARDHNIKGNTLKFKAHTGKGVIAGEKVLLAQPQTFMNNSGEAVRLLVDYFGIPLDKLIVIYDDLDLPVGKIRVKESGGAGGHKGIKSIIRHLNSEQIPRIRVGIGRPPEFMEVTDYVLSRFDSDEEKIIKGTIEELNNVVELIIKKDFEQAMNEYN